MAAFSVECEALWLLVFLIDLRCIHADSFHVHSGLPPRHNYSFAVWGSDIILWSCAETARNLGFVIWKRCIWDKERESWGDNSQCKRNNQSKTCLARTKGQPEAQTNILQSREPCRVSRTAFAGPCLMNTSCRALSFRFRYLTPRACGIGCIGWKNEWFFFVKHTLPKLYLCQERTLYQHLISSRRDLPMFLWDP